MSVSSLEQKFLKNIQIVRLRSISDTIVQWSVTCKIFSIEVRSKTGQIAGTHFSASDGTMMQSGAILLVTYLDVYSFLEEPNNDAWNVTTGHKMEHR